MNDTKERDEFQTGPDNTHRYSSLIGRVPNFNASNAPVRGKSLLHRMGGAARRCAPIAAQNWQFRNAISRHKGRVQKQCGIPEVVVRSAVSIQKEPWRYLSSSTVLEDGKTLDSKVIKNTSMSKNFKAVRE